VHTNGTTLSDMRILVVDDNEANAELLRQILIGAGYRDVRVTRDAAAVAGLCQRAPQPDLVMLDLHMPVLDGWEILGQLQPLLRSAPSLAVLVVTADSTRSAKRRALALGASDFLTKPIDATEVLLRTGNLLRSRELQKTLNELVATRTDELEQARYDVLYRLALAAEYRDDQTGEHIQRVGRTAGLIAGQLELPSPTADLIGAAALLHDVGKIGIPDQILLKPGRLTPPEMEKMRSHVDLGARILADGDCPHLQLAYSIALYHHERWDGAGYNSGFSGAAIPIEARITSVADTFDAMTHDRPYRVAGSVDEAVGEIVGERGRQFDPQVVDAFLEMDHHDLAHPREMASHR
jgi:putative two-component system response regulator